MATQITEQARSSLDSPQRTIDEARDLDSQRASSLLEHEVQDGIQPDGENPNYDPSPEAEIRRLLASRNRARRERDEMTDKYNELLFAVGLKFPGETRHQTALRYIKQAESASDLSVNVAEMSDFLPTSAGSVAASPKTAAGRGFLRT